MIKVGIVDDQNIFRQSLALMIESVADFQLVVDEPGGKELLATLDSSKEFPEVILMDMSMPGMSGIEVNELLQRDYPSIKVIVLSVHAQNRLIAKMIAAGSAGYLIKNCDRVELITAIRTVAATGYYMNKQVLQAIQENTRRRARPNSGYDLSVADLTNREQEVLIYICKELSSSQIAEKLFLSIRTVEGHRNTLLLKTQSRNTAGLVLYAIRNQLFEVL